MDLKKLFVYVPAASEASFIANVINVSEEAAKYSNKIVFLEDSNRIWVKGVFYGTDLETLGKKFQSIWATIGLTAKEDGTSALSKVVGETTYTDLVAWIEALVADEADKRGDADDEIISSYQSADSAIISGYQGADSAIVTAYEAADSAIISGYQGADSAIISGYQGADAAIISSYEAADAAIIAQLPAVAVEGSGLDLRVDTDEQTGKKTYTVIADQSIWEFMGAATAADVASVAATLNGKYDGPSGTGEGKVHRNPEAGDVWAVTITETGNTILYACDSVSGATGTWTQIGSAQGISGVDTTKSHGIGLTNTSSVVGISVEDGAIADGVTYFITGGTAYAKFEEVIAAYEAADEAIISAYEDADEAIISAYEDADEAIISAYEAADEAIISAYEAADGLIISSYEAADSAIITAYQNADTAIINAYTAADEAINAAKTKSVAANSADASYLTVDSTNDANGYAYTINFNEQAMFNYVSDNIWETYSAS